MGTVAAAGPAAAFGPLGSPRRRAPAGALVLIELLGGNDGLNTLVPLNDEAYARNRPHLAIRADRAIRLSDAFGLHPAAVGLAELFERGDLAIVRDVGWPGPCGSHPAARQIWHRGSTDERQPGGWIGRYQAISEGRTRLYCAAADGQDQTLPGLFAPADNRQPVAVRRPHGPRRPSGNYPASRLGRSLQATAEAIMRTDGTCICYVSLGGFDTHAAQAERHARLLRQLGGALRAFACDLKARKLFDRTLVLVFSEFGRSLSENAMAGTDHGGTGLVLLAGGRVRLGIYGAPSQETRCRDDSPGGLLDFRRLYAAILTDWLQADSTHILGKAFRPLPVILG